MCLSLSFQTIKLEQEPEEIFFQFKRPSRRQPLEVSLHSIICSQFKAGSRNPTSTNSAYYRVMRMFRNCEAGRKFKFCSLETELGFEKLYGILNCQIRLKTSHRAFIMVYYTQSKLLKRNMFYKIQLVIYVDWERRIVSMHYSHVIMLKK